MKKHVSAGLVLFRKEGGEFYFLLLHYLGGHWDFVKGHVEGDETLEQTALRELTEETGIQHAMIYPNFEEKINYNYYHEGQKQDKDVLFLLGETSERNVVLSHEHQGYVWLPYGQSLKHLTFENAQNVLLAAGRYLGIS
jgi:8-oxo-dGTP pyrophosphatase MutT (NUDIX family)